MALFPLQTRPVSLREPPVTAEPCHDLIEMLHEDHEPRLEPVVVFKRRYCILMPWAPVDVVTNSQSPVQVSLVPFWHTETLGDTVSVPIGIMDTVPARALNSSSGESMGSDPVGFSFLFPHSPSVPLLRCPTRRRRLLRRGRCWLTCCAWCWLRCARHFIR